MKNLALSAKQITLQFGAEDPLFSDVNFDIEKGDFVCIIGPNGAGKTSLVKIIMGLLKPTSGEIHLYESKIGYVPQYLNRDEFSPMTVEELLLLKMSPNFFSRTGAYKSEMNKILSTTNIEHVLNKKLHHLSGGEMQRVMIAYALIDRPGLLILDEPVSGIDIHGEQDFYELLEQIHQEFDITIMMISHDIDIVYQYATNVICLNRTLVCQGVPKDVLDKDVIEKTFSKNHAIYHHQH